MGGNAEWNELHKILEEQTMLTRVYREMNMKNDALRCSFNACKAAEKLKQIAKKEWEELQA